MNNQFLISIAAVIGIGIMILGGLLWERQITSVLLNEIEQKKTHALRR